MTDDRADKLFAGLVNQGFHVLIIEGESTTGVQPMTDKGREAVRSLMREGNRAGIIDDASLEATEADHFMVRIPRADPERIIAAELVQDHGLPEGSVALIDKVNATTVELDEPVH